MGNPLSFLDIQDPDPVQEPATQEVANPLSFLEGTTQPAEPETTGVLTGMTRDQVREGFVKQRDAIVLAGMAATGFTGPRARGVGNAFVGFGQMITEFVANPISSTKNMLTDFSEGIGAAADAGLIDTAVVLGKGLVELVELPFEVLSNREIDALAFTIDPLTPEELTTKTQQVVGEAAGFMVGFGIGTTVRRASIANKAFRTLKDIDKLTPDELDRLVTGLASRTVRKEAMENAKFFLLEGVPAGVTIGAFTGEDPRERFSNMLMFGSAAAVMAPALGFTGRFLGAGVKKTFRKPITKSAEALDLAISERARIQSAGLMSLGSEGYARLATEIINGELVPEALAHVAPAQRAMVFRGMGKATAENTASHGKDLLVYGEGALTKKQIADFKRHGHFEGEQVTYAGKDVTIKKIVGKNVIIEGESTPISFDDIRAANEFALYEGKGIKGANKTRIADLDLDAEDFAFIKKINQELIVARRAVALDAGQKANAYGYYTDNAAEGLTVLKKMGSGEEVATFRTLDHLDTMLDEIPMGSGRLMQKGLPIDLELPPGGIVGPERNGFSTFIGKASEKVLTVGGLTRKIELFLDQAEITSTVPSIFNRIDAASGLNTFSLAFLKLQKALRVSTNATEIALEGLEKHRTLYNQLSQKERINIATALQEAGGVDNVIKRKIISRVMNAEEIQLTDDILELVGGDRKSLSAVGKHALDRMRVVKNRPGIPENALKAALSEVDAKAKLSGNQLRAVTLLEQIMGESDDVLDTRAILSLATEKIKIDTSPTVLSPKAAAFRKLMAEYYETQRDILGEAIDKRYNFEQPQTRNLLDNKMSEAYGRFGKQQDQADHILYSIFSDAKKIDPLGANAAFVRRKIRERFVKPITDRRSEASKEIRDAIKIIEQKGDLKDAEFFKGIVDRWFGSADGSLGNRTIELGEAGVKGWFKKIFKWNGQEVDDISRVLTQLTTIRYLGFRPVLGVRDLTSPFLNYYSRYGLKRTNALRHELLNLDRAESLRASGRGDNPNQLRPILSEVGAIPVGEEVIQGIGSKAVSGLTQIAFDATLQKPIFDKVTRAVFNESKKHFMGLLKETQDPALIAKRSQLHLYEAGVQKEVVTLLKQGQWERAANAIGEATSRDVNIDYGITYATPAYRSGMGKIVAQFGSYPIGMLRVLNRYAADPAVATRMLAAGTGMTLTGAALGINLSAWHYTPIDMIFTGGPLLDDIGDVFQLSSQRDTEAFFKAVDAILPVPTGAIRDLNKILGED